MKDAFLLLFLVFMMSCGVQKNGSVLEDLQDPISKTLKNCLADGNCKIEILPNQSLELKKDDFGLFYGETIKSELLLFKVSYERKVPEGVADAHYSETYFFSIPKTTTSLELNDAELGKVNLVVERQCFCKGSAGFFKILSGNLKLSIKKNELTLNGHFSHENLPLLMTKIDEKVSLEP